MQLPLFLEDVKVSEVLILIEPPKEITEYVTLLKKEIREEFGEFKSSGSKAHILVNDFLIMEERLDPTLSVIEKHLSKFNSFRLQLNGFSSFGNSNTVFINIEASDAFNHLIDEFEILRQEVIKTKKFSHTKSPHITIASKLNKQAFKELRRRFEPLHFNHEFEVDKLAVLRFDKEQNKYEHLRDIKLSV
jgi:2'-5' RNA ligase